MESIWFGRNDDFEKNWMIENKNLEFNWEFEDGKTILTEVLEQYSWIRTLYLPL